MVENVEFEGCKHLDFSDNYSVRKELISLGGQTKVCWNRIEMVGSADLVQFCKLRGRLNNPDACHCEEAKMCNEFEITMHKVPLSSINLE